MYNLLKKKLQLTRKVIFMAIAIIISGLLVLGIILKIDEQNTERGMIVTVQSTSCRQIAEYMQEYEMLQEINKGEDWAENISKYFVDKDECYYFEIPQGKRIKASSTGIYLIDREKVKEDTPVLIGYTDTYMVLDKKGACYLFFMRGNEVISVPASEWKLRLIVGDEAYENRKVSFYFAP